MNDGSARDYQIRKFGGPGMRGKTLDTFAPRG
jgi:2-keto-4-pentenoate hydratase/2-oxohepta-3-ene-1,7-dioic acid hydratase in catechol pathway